MSEQSADIAPDEAAPAGREHGPEVIKRFAKTLPGKPGVYRMYRRQGRRALCRQGAQPEGSRFQLYAAGRAHQPHCGDDRQYRVDGVRHHPHRAGGTAARSQPDQAVEAALQCHPARRQVVSLYPDRQGPRGRPDHQASRGAQPQGQLLWTLCLGGFGQRHHQLAAEGVFAAFMHRQLLREPHPALPALPDQALLGAVHRRDLAGGLRRAGRSRPRPSCRASRMRSRSSWHGKWSRPRKSSTSSAPPSTATGFRRSAT